MCQGHVTSRVSRRCPALSPCPSPPCVFRLALLFALRSDILMKPVEFVVYSSSLTNCVPGYANVLMCSLHISPLSSELPWTTTSQDHWICLFQAEAPDIPQERWVKNIPYVSWLCKEGRSSSLLSNWSTITCVLNDAEWFYWLST